MPRGLVAKCLDLVGRTVNAALPRAARPVSPSHNQVLGHAVERRNGIRGEGFPLRVRDGQPLHISALQFHGAHIRDKIL